jgi:hypothetical protein
MTWTYSGNPGASDKDQLRFYLGDVNPQLPLLSDEECNFLLSQWEDDYNSPMYVAAVAAEALASRFAREVDISADGVSVQIGQLQQRFITLAEQLRNQYKALYGFFDPATAQDILSVDWNPDINPLVFGIGFNDNYLAGRQNYGDYHPGRSTDWWRSDVQNEPIVWG